MPVCSRCGAWNQDAARSCEKCGAKITPDPAPAAPVAATLQKPSPVQSAGIAPASGLFEQRRQKFFLYAALLALLLVAGVLSVKRSAGEYDASGQCTLDSHYTIETRTSSSGTVESVKYLVTYKFEVNGQQYTGKASLLTKPTVAGVPVYFMANDPKENGLTPNRAIPFFIISAGVAFVLVIVAYWLLPKNYPLSSAAAARAVMAGIGDSGNEPARMKRGKYSASVYLHFAFFAQMALVMFLAALGLAAVFHLEKTSYTVLGLAAILAAVITLWMYADRWRCIETFSSRFCSGLANFSIFYVPVIAFVYANYRGLKKLGGR